MIMIYGDLIWVIFNKIRLSPKFLDISPNWLSGENRPLGPDYYLTSIN